MIRLAGIVLAVAGIALLSFGISVAPGLGPKAAQILEQAPSDHALLLMAIGAGGTALGLALAGRSRSGHHP